MKQRAHCLLQICWADSKWTTATLVATLCNWYTLRELLRNVVSINGDYLDEFLVHVLDGSVVCVRLNTTGDIDVSLKAFVPQGRTSASGFHFECHTVFTHWKSTLMATALKFHPGSLIKESHSTWRMFALNVTASV